ncbi:MAG: AraC family transcriptional regulator [Eubacterium sp.]|nr:AraC family transcriptional regulator [Eubacterium sp.]
MALQKCGLNVNSLNKELLPHGTQAFPCAGYESAHTASVEDLIIWHWHEEIEVIYIKKGTMQLQVLSEHFNVHEGELAVINANALHTAWGSPYCELQSLVFSPILITGSPDSAFALKYITPITECSRFSCIILNRDNSQAANLFSEAFQALKTDAFGYEFTVREKLSLVLMIIYKQLKPYLLETNTPKSTDSLRIAEMLKYIHTNFSGEVTLSDIAAVSGISEREALRCFKRTIGESPVQYLVKYRLMQSADMLSSEPTKSITEIAGDCGFDSPAYYTKKFKELYLCTPKDYRQNNEQNLRSH